MTPTLTKRIISGFLLIIAPLLIIAWAPSVSHCVILATLSTLALLEFYHLLRLINIPAFRIIGVIFSILLVVGTWVSCVLKTGHEWEITILAGIVMTTFIRQFPQKNNDQPLATIACTLLGILYVPFLFNYFTRLAFTWEPPGILGRMGLTGQLLVVYLIVVVKFTDVGAFLVGSQIGRHKLIPRLSPGKTWEGFIGGVAAGLLMSLGLFWIFQGQFGRITMHWYDAVILGILLSVLGTLGDLTESMLKRAAGAKDSSNLVPGMGGILDVVDSLLFAVPAMYIYAKWFMDYSF